MKTKIQKKYTYHGLGFPVALKDVEMVQLGDEWHPKIDVRKVADRVIKQLAEKEKPLTGCEVRFIRAHLGMSLREFASEVVHESHTAVKKWEDENHEPTKMNGNTEFAIRNYIIEKTTSTAERKSKYYERTTQAKKFYKYVDKAQGKKPRASSGKRAGKSNCA